jgi:hypothetical protein
LPGFFFRNAAATANHASTRDLRPVGEGTDDLRAERFANDSPLDEAVTSEPVSEVKFRSLGRFKA